MPAKIDIELVLGDETGTGIAAKLPASDPKTAYEVLANILAGVAGGQRRGRLRVGVDESVGVGASATITLAKATCTANDIIRIGDVPITAVAGAVASTDAETWQMDGANDAAVAQSVCNAINFSKRLSIDWIATIASNVVTVTARKVGSGANGIPLRKTVTNGAGVTLSAATFTGGVDAGGKRPLTATLSGAWTANDTVTIGTVVLTAKASPVGENEFALGASATAAAANLAAAIIAHSKLKGLVNATSAIGVCTITLLLGGRIGALITIAKSATACTLSRTDFAPATTETQAYSLAEFNLGAL